MVFKDILAQMLNDVPNNEDKRVGSVVYTSLAPAAKLGEDLYAAVAEYLNQSSPETATGEYLDKQAGGLIRGIATQAIRIGKTYDTDGNLVRVLTGTRYLVAGQELSYVLTKYTEVGTCHLVCEQFGSKGNDFVGTLLPVSSVINLGRIEITDTLVPAQDDETDEEFRPRVMLHLSRKGFGGNVAAYRAFLSEIDGVGESIVFHAPYGGGTVLVSVVDEDYNPISEEFQNIIKEMIDPELDTTAGIGFAPPNHRVYVSTPVLQTVDVSVKLQVSPEVNLSQVRPFAIRAIEDEINARRKEWGGKEFMHIYVANIIYALLSVNDIVNATDVKINGVASDLMLTNNKYTQEMPIVGTITVI